MQPRNFTSLPETYSHYLSKDNTDLSDRFVTVIGITVLICLIIIGAVVKVKKPDTPSENMQVQAQVDAESLLIPPVVPVSVFPSTIPTSIISYTPFVDPSGPPDVTAVTINQGAPNQQAQITLMGSNFMKEHNTIEIIESKECGRSAKIGPVPSSDGVSLTFTLPEQMSDSCTGEAVDTGPGEYQLILSTKLGSQHSTLFYEESE